MTLPENDREIVILYVEDVRETLSKWTKYIQETYSPDSRGIRSLEEAYDLFDEGFEPHFVIHDCLILRYLTDDKDTAQAGKALYAEYVNRKLDVVVLTGSNHALEGEPYRSHRPLHVLEKPTGQDKIDLAVEIWKKSHAKPA